MSNSDHTSQDQNSQIFKIKTECFEKEKIQKIKLKKFWDLGRSCDWDSNEVS